MNTSQIKNVLFVTALLSAAVSEVAATVYIGHNFFTGQWSATLDPHDPCKGRSHVADFAKLLEGGNIPKILWEARTLQYNMAFCGTKDIALFDGGDTRSFNHKCEYFTKNIGCGWVHQWKC
ncbi:hypothetical protein NQ176_g62 [Zarea fungicola]|uniref:Uncharacterized protein n=1 Tax=Zarea fungicola TaxID=93591 RepID=A0ACC1P0R3_9HYPO|nr:hypothetical protein NQ176_g62 [Lecanicillium fungicola]